MLSSPNRSASATKPISSTHRQPHPDLGGGVLQPDEHVAQAHAIGPAAATASPVAATSSANSAEQHELAPGARRRSSENSSDSSTIAAKSATVAAAIVSLADVAVDLRRRP